MAVIWYACKTFFHLVEGLLALEQTRDDLSSNTRYMCQDGAEADLTTDHVYIMIMLYLRTNINKATNVAVRLESIATRLEAMGHRY